ncbi:MAG: PQQ-dependent sugar dehydrogenase [Planctomycetota bacterium]|nr:PQQ-dependent sugar dehydrogenase [Planctomycetota bacterium]
MSRVIAIGLILSIITGNLASQAADKVVENKPYGLENRVPFTTSRVVGSPEPPSPYKTERVFPNLKMEQPISIEPEPGTNNLWFTQHLGSWSGGARIHRVKNEENVSQTDVMIEFKTEMAYAVTFHPKYEQNGFFYVYLNDKKNPVVHNRIFRFTVDRNPPYKTKPESKLEIIAWPSNGHDGGGIHFGPKDGYLYASTGDGSSDSDTYGSGQDISDIPGSVIRIDVDHTDPGRAYSIPRDNPFLGFPGARPELWAYGLRNPWKLDFDESNGQLWVGANGQDLWETVHLIKRGDNHGWPIYEGSHAFHLDRPRGPTPPVKPAAEHHHSEARSLTGGVVYTGQKLPELTGAFIYGDYSTGRVWAIKHDGTKATFHKELVDTPFAITGFGNDPNGELWVIDHAGMFYRIVPNDRTELNKDFPTKLSETGLFTDVKSHRFAAGVVPYAPAAPFWSDGAIKIRAIGVPGTESVDTKSERWEAPDGSVTIKSFQLEMQSGEPASRKYIETRIMVRQQKEWTGYTYLWNDEQTDATLVDKNGLDKPYRVIDKSNPQGFRDQVWHYPSRTECMVCHSRAANFVLGFSPLQLDSDFNYGEGRTDNQLRALYHIGLLKNEKGYERRKPDAPHLVDPNDKQQPLEARARSYFYTNCASCHVDAGGGNSLMNMDFKAKGHELRMIGVKPIHVFPEKVDARLIDPGHPENSVVYLRVNRRGNGQMPPLGSNVVDQKSVELLKEWIEKLTAEDAKIPEKNDKTAE